MARYQTPTALKVIFWLCWWALLLAYSTGPFFLPPVDPPVP